MGRQEARWRSLGLTNYDFVYSRSSQVGTCSLLVHVRNGTVDSADQFRGRPGVEIVEPLKVVSRGRDWLEAWNQVWHW